MKQIIVIPARMGGSRLPGKPLIEIKGIPMIERVWNQCKIKNKDQIYVATEDIEIEEFCDSKGIQSINTGPAPLLLIELNYLVIKLKLIHI